MVINDGMKSIVIIIVVVTLYNLDVYQTVYNEMFLNKFLHSYFYDSQIHDNVFKLATINLTEAEESNEKFNKVAKELVTAFKEVGFAYVADCKGFQPDELFHWTKWFFNLSEHDKMRLAKKSFRRDNPNVYRGYLPILPGGHSYKEGFELGVFNNEEVTGRHLTPEEVTNQTVNSQGRKYMRNILSENNVWPVTADPVRDKMFRRELQKQHKAIRKAGEILIHLMAVGLGFDRNQFDHHFGSRNIATLRLIHYPTRLDNPDEIPSNAWDGNRAIVTGEHRDSSILTLLTTFTNRGLQIKPPGHTEWMDVPVIKDRLVINIGALLQQLVEGHMIATNHRVLDIGTDRYSAAMFYGFNYAGSIEKTFFGNVNKIAGAFKKYGPWMTNRTKMFSESATTDFGVDEDESV